MPSVDFAPNKENELDEEVLNRLPVRKARHSSSTRRSFGKFLDSAINEIREESDQKLAMKFQAQESNSYINQKINSDEKMTQQDKDLANTLSRGEYEGRLSTRADDKCTPIKTSSIQEGSCSDSKHAQAECKGSHSYALSPDEEKACTPFESRRRYGNDEGFLDDERFHLVEDERIAASLHIMEQKELHKQRIGELFDEDYAKHLGRDESNNSALCYAKYVEKKWENVESYLDDVEGGICISLLLPDLDTYDVSIYENHSIQVDAVRNLRHSSDDASHICPIEYKADYSFEGATKGIDMDMVQHEYIKQSGILFIFVEKLKLRGPSSQCYVSPSKSKAIDEAIEKPHLVNEKEPNHYVSKNQTNNSAMKQNSFMLRVKKSTLGRMLSFSK